MKYFDWFNLSKHTHIHFDFHLLRRMMEIQYTLEVAMDIRFAQKQDITDILKLLAQVNLIHHQARPDILKKELSTLTKRLQQSSIIHNDQF